MSQPLDLLDEVIERYEKVKRQAKADFLEAARKAKAEEAAKEAEAKSETTEP